MNDIELKIAVSNGWVVDAKVMPDGCCQLIVVQANVTAEDTTCNQQKGIFKKVPASELRVDDVFMKHQPKTRNERELKELIANAIQRGLNDFWRPVYDPSFDSVGRLNYEQGKKPAMGKNHKWWKEEAKKFCPERGSRLGTKLEYVAFLAVLMKELVASGKSLEWVWNAVCNNSKELGNYTNCHENEVCETTGSREVCGWYDLANTGKILAEDKEYGSGFWIASGTYSYFSQEFPLARLGKEYGNFVFSDTCGWVVFDSCPDC